MSDTPETEDEIRMPTMPAEYMGEAEIVDASFAKRLERERNEAKSALAEIYDAMIRYEGDVDGEAPSSHHRMMNRVRDILFKDNDQIQPANK